MRYLTNLVRLGAWGGVERNELGLAEGLRVASGSKDEPFEPTSLSPLEELFRTFYSLAKNSLRDICL